MDLEVRHLRLVVAVAEHGSLTAAAEQLHLTQSALSHQLRDIEDRLRAPLFLRRNRRMTPTPAGQRLIEAGLAVLAQLERTETAVRDLGQEKQGLLRVATECYTCYHWLPGVLREFGARCPGVDVQIQLEATSRPLPVLLAGKLDLALMLSPVRDRRLAATPLFRDELVVVVPARHRFASQPYVHASQLADENMFTYSPREDSYVFQRLLTPAGISPRRLQQVQLTEAILELVRAGLGVSVLARWAVRAVPGSAIARRRALDRERLLPQLDGGRPERARRDALRRRVPPPHRVTRPGGPVRRDVAAGASGGAPGRVAGLRCAITDSASGLLLLQKQQRRPELRPIGRVGSRAHRGELRVVLARLAGIARELGGAGRPVDALETIRLFLQVAFVHRERVGGSLERHQQVTE